MLFEAVCRSPCTGGSRTIRAIKSDRTWLIADVHGMPTFEENLKQNPLAPLMYGFSVICFSRRMTAEAGFTRFATKDFDNPINAYYEVRP